MISVYPVSVSIMSASLFLNKQQRCVFMVPVILSDPDSEEMTGCHHSLAYKEMMLTGKHHHAEYTGWDKVYDVFAANGCTQLKGLAAHQKIKISTRTIKAEIKNK